MTRTNDPDAAALLAPWSGPYGGLPPFDIATPRSIESALREAIARKRAEVRAIADNPKPPTFENTIAALENSGRDLSRVDCLFRVFSSTMSVGGMGEVEKRVAPLASALEDEIAHDEALFGRIAAVHEARFAAGLTDEQQRLTDVMHQGFSRRGAGLSAVDKGRLARINGRLAELQARFNQNLVADQAAQVVFVEDEAELEGLSEPLRAAAAAAAVERGRPGAWAIGNVRPAVWPILTWAARRDLREKVWRMWARRGANPGDHDNTPVIAELLRLRGKKARLLGFDDFAHLQMADRMAGAPETAMALMQKVWARVIEPTREQIAELQALAVSEGGNFDLAPWDRHYYAEKLRKARFGLDAAAVKVHLELGSVLEAMFWAAGRLHGLVFTELADVRVCHPDVRVFEVSRDGEALGVIYFDLFQRPGKGLGSWQAQYRSAETFAGRVLPISSVNSSLQPAQAGEPVLLGWEYANVLFHELGHALHMLSNQASYPSLGSMGVAWDFIELPALLNERWLYDRDLLNRFARHHQTGEPMPAEMIDGIERGARFDRVFTLTLDYLGGAITDVLAHLEADGGDVDAVAIERDMLAKQGMPEAIDLILPVHGAVHIFGGSHYAAGLYSYLWADVMAADVAQTFEAAPGGYYDAETAERWRRTVLSAGARIPAAEAFRNFLGRDPEPDALLRRYGLADLNA